MIARRDWGDEAEAWEVIKPIIRSSLMSDLVETMEAARASGKLRSRPPEYPFSNGEEFHLGDLENWLKRAPGRPKDTGLDAAGDTALAILALSIRAAGEAQTDAAAIRQAIARHEAAGIAVKGNGVARSTVERIRRRLEKLPR